MVSRTKLKNRQKMQYRINWRAISRWCRFIWPPKLTTISENGKMERSTTKKWWVNSAFWPLNDENSLKRSKPSKKRSNNAWKTLTRFRNIRPALAWNSSPNSAIRYFRLSGFNLWTNTTRCGIIWILPNIVSYSPKPKNISLNVKMLLNVLLTVKSKI